MTPQPSIDLVASLKDSRETLLESLAGITETNAARHPGPDRWCALDCVEHLTVAEEVMLDRLKTADPLAEPIHLPEREARLTEGVSSRANRVQAPPAALPAGRFASLAEALEAYTTARGQTIAFVEAASNLRSVQVIHPFFGPLSGHELALLMAAHSVRHAAQIREIREQIE